MPHEAGHFRSCLEIFAELSSYLDAELPPEACREIDAHLAGCACREIDAHLAGCGPCIEFVNSLRKTVEICRKYEPGGLPEPLSQRAREQLLEAYRRMLAARNDTPPAAPAT